MTTQSVGIRALAPRPQRLPLPAAVNVHRIIWFPTIFLVGYHPLALLAFVPWFFLIARPPDSGLATHE